MKEFLIVALRLIPFLTAEGFEFDTEVILWPDGSRESNGRTLRDTVRIDVVARNVKTSEEWLIEVKSQYIPRRRFQRAVNRLVEYGALYSKATQSNPVLILLINHAYVQPFMADECRESNVRLFLLHADGTIAKAPDIIVKPLGTLRTRALCSS